jgi:hypothetical protein
MKLDGIFGASIFAFTAACTTGSVGGDDGPPGDDGIDPNEDRITCQAEITLAGTLVPSDPQPLEIQGCWPIGTWNFAPTVTTNTCATPPPLLPTYSFVGERDLASAEPDYTWVFTVTEPAGDPTADVGVSSGGGGLCTGALMVFSADGLSVANLHPALQVGGIITGQGTYEVHTKDQRPPPPI